MTVIDISSLKHNQQRQVKELTSSLDRARLGSAKLVEVLGAFQEELTGMSMKHQISLRWLIFLLKKLGVEEMAYTDEEVTEATKGLNFQFEVVDEHSAIIRYVKAPQHGEEQHECPDPKADTCPLLQVEQTPTPEQSPA